jgi:hypothetical protein
VKFRTILIGLVASAILGHAAAAATRSTDDAVHSLSSQYFRLEGDAAESTATQVDQELQKTFCDPLKNLAIRNSWTRLVYGPKNHFVFNLIIEPMNPDSLADYKSYVQSIDAISFHGQVVVLKNVSQIIDDHVLQIGMYNAQSESSFDLAFDAHKKTSFANFADWSQFEATYGQAIISTDHSIFKNYLVSYIQNMPESAKISALLAQNNMMSINSSKSLVFDDGTTTGSDWLTTPLSAFNYWRMCFDPKFENGFCF